MGNIYNEIIESIKKVFTDGVSIDNYVFKMHRAFTVLLCLLFASILAVEQVSIYFWCLGNEIKLDPVILCFLQKKNYKK